MSASVVVSAGYDVRNLATHIAEANSRAGQLMATILHGSIGIAGFTYGFKKSFVDIAVGAEKARAKLKAIEETDGRAEAAMAWTRQFRDSTALALGDVREAWAELRTAGIRPTGVMMTALADAATSTGKTLAQVAGQFAEVVQHGGQGISALRAFGIEGQVQGASLILQYRYLGKVIREVVPKDNQFLVSQKLLEIFTKKFGGAALEASHGWDGMLIRMSESWQDFALEVMDKGGVFKVLKKQLDDFVSGGKRGTDGMAENARSLADGLKEVIVAGFAMARWARDELPGIIRFARGTIDAIGGLKVALLATLAAMSAPFLMSLLRAGISLGTLGWTIARILLPTLMGLAYFTAATLIPIIYSLGAALLTTPVGWIIMGIAAVIAAAWLLYNNWDQVVAFLGQLWGEMVDGASASWESLKRLAKETGDWIAAAWTAAVAELASIGAGAASKLTAAWESVRAFFAQLWTDIRSGFDAAFGWISQGIDKLKSMMPSLPSMPTLSSAGQAATAVGDWARTRVDGAIKIAIDVTGQADAKVTQSRTSGPVEILPELGQSMAFQ